MGRITTHWNGANIGLKTLSVRRTDPVVTGWLYSGGRLTASIETWVIAGTSLKVSYRVIESTVDAFWAAQRPLSHICFIRRTFTELFAVTPGAYVSDGVCTLTFTEPVMTFPGLDCPTTRLPSSLT